MFGFICKIFNGTVVTLFKEISSLTPNKVEVESIHFFELNYEGSFNKLSILE